MATVLPITGQIKVLFVCTGNACRSQMAEALLRAAGGDRFTAYSAGSHPAGYIHPLAVVALERYSIEMVGHHSKSWDTFKGEPMDLVITLCDAAAAEACPVVGGGAMVAHWPHRDPAGFEGTEHERVAFAGDVGDSLRDKVKQLVGLDFANTPRDKLLARIRAIGD